MLGLPGHVVLTLTRRYKKIIISEKNKDIFDDNGSDKSNIDYNDRNINKNNNNSSSGNNNNDNDNNGNNEDKILTNNKVIDYDTYPFPQSDIFNQNNTTNNDDSNNNNNTTNTENDHDDADNNYIIDVFQNCKLFTINDCLANYQIELNIFRNCEIESTNTDIFTRSLRNLTARHSRNQIVCRESELLCLSQLMIIHEQKYLSVLRALKKNHDDYFNNIYNYDNNLLNNNNNNNNKDRKSTRLNSSHLTASRMPSSA